MIRDISGWGKPHSASHATSSYLSLIAIAVFLLVSIDVPVAQQIRHLNPVIQRLIEGKVVIGVTTQDFSVNTANALVRSNVDFVRMEMEHQPFNIEAVRMFLLGMLDKTAILKKGNAQMDVAPIIRIPPYGRESSDWIVKQVLDQGMMGVIFPAIETKAQALAACRSMRYPQSRGSRYFEPAGLRGSGAGNAIWFWGVSGDQYKESADLWPLNPQGDLLCIPMIETVEGVKNANEILSVPGVGSMFIGALGDLPNSVGMPQGSPEVEAAVQTVLKACLAHKVACMYPAQTVQDVQKRAKEGWKIMSHGGGNALTAGVDAFVRDARSGLQ